MSRPRSCECGECERCKKRIRAYERYHNEPGYADRIRAQSLRYREMHIVEVRARDRARGFHEFDPQKIYARNATRVLRKEPHDCERCGAANAHAHHDDYTRPLDVRWLCRACHAVEHRKVP